MRKVSIIKVILVFGLLLGTSLAHADLKNGLIAYYPFNGNANDESGNENHGQLFGDIGINAVSGICGFPHSALEFDGSGSYIKIEKFDTLSSFTLSFWVKLTSHDPQIHYSALCGPDQKGGYGFVMDNYNKLRFRVGENCIERYSNHLSVDYNKNLLPLSTWINIAGIYNQLENKAKLFINGEFVGETIGTINSFTLNDQYIGTDLRHPGSSQYDFRGSIDELRIYDRALLEPEIQELFIDSCTIESTIDIKPDKLNLKSKGKWITAYIQLPDEFDVNDIDVDTIMLHYNIGKVHAKWGVVQENIFMAKFDRSQVKELLPSQTGYFELSVTGEVEDKTFEGFDIIKVK